MRIRTLAVFVLVLGLFLGLPAGCGGGAEDYGTYAYAAPSGWEHYVPPPGITFAPTMTEFRRTDTERTADSPCLRIWEVTDVESRTERVGALYARAQCAQWRFLCREAEQRGAPAPAFECEPTRSAIEGPGVHDAWMLVLNRDGSVARTMVSFVELPDGRRFRAEYTGIEPEFSQYLSEITTSLGTLTFAPAPPVAPLPRDAIIADLQNQRDGAKLWLYDGEVAGRPLADEHLAVLSDPAFAGVTNLNLISGHAALTTGVDITDDGLRHLAELPLESLCLRGSLVTDAGLEHLARMPLKSLVLSGTLVAGDGLRHLAGMPLQVLDLEGTDVDDASIEHLAQMPLLSVNFRGTNVTDAGRTKFASYRPRTVVSH